MHHSRNHLLTPVCRARLCGDRLCGDRGETSTALLVMPLAIAMLVLVINVGMHWLGRSVVEAAAADGLTASQSFGVSGDAASSAALEALSGFGLLRTPAGAQAVVVDRGDTTISVTVTAEVEAFLFPSLGVITATAEGPAERYYTPDERRSPR